jgi:hydrogenase nickel incorporation protein HypA/HybF
MQQKLQKLEVKIIALSGIEPKLLKTAFETFKERTMCKKTDD